MTIRSPLVLGPDGLAQQLQPGDSIQAPMNTPSIRAVTNGEGAAAIVAGAPVYASAADTVKRAQANAKNTSGVIGLGFDPSIAAGAVGNICDNGMLVLTTAQWDAVAGTAGGLTFNTLYFLDPANAGKITSTVPTTAGWCSTIIGRALSTTELSINLREPTQL